MRKSHYLIPAVARCDIVTNVKHNSDINNSLPLQM